MKNNYFFSGFTRHLFCWLSMLLIGLMAPTGLMAQTTLSTGDIAFVGFNGVDDQSNGNNSNDKFSFVLLKSVTANTRIFFTDFGWLTGGGFQTVSPSADVGSKEDGIISWTASTSLAAGTQVVILCKYNLSASTGTVAGVEQIPGKSYYMDIGDPGADNIFAYQAASARDANPTLLAGIRTAGVQTTWDATLSNSEFTPAKTTLPAALTANGVNAALYLKGSFYTIAIYKCTLNNGFSKALRNAINNPANWEYPNPGTFCEGYIYAPNDPDCPQSGIPTGYNLPINCTFTVAQVQIATQPVSKTVCAGQPVSFTSTASNATAYQWQVSTNGGGSFSNLSNGGVYTGATSTILTISNTTGLNGYQYRLIASESTEPSSATSSAATLTVDNGPQNLVLNPSGPLSCTTTTVNLTASATGATGYFFSGPGITAQGSNTATVNMAGTYSVTATSVNSCTAVATTTVTGNQTAPTAGLTNDGPLSCLKTSVTLTASGGGTYKFSAGATQIGSGNTATVNTASTYSVTVTSANGCTAVASTTVTGNQTAPTAGLTNDGPLSCLKTSVILTASGGGTYQFSAGATQIGSTNQATVTTAGTYSVTVTGTNGCTTVASTTVSGDQTPPTATLTASSTAVCSPASITLTAGGGVSYSFSAGAAQIGSTNQAVVTQSGTYSVIVTGVNGCTSTTSITVAVNPLPVPTLSVSGTITCAQPTQLLTAGGGTSYAFAGPGLVAQNTSSGSATVNAGGLYSVTATSSGCSATTNVTVSEDKNAPTMPTLTASPSTTLTCAQTSLTLTASATGTGLSYAFSGPGGSLAGTGNSRAVSVAGTYSVTITGANGCTTSQSIVIYSNTIAPTATLTASSTAVCTPASITLTAGGGVSYSFSAGAAQIGSTNQAVVTQSGTYSVIVTGVNGCTSTTSITVAVNPLPPAPTLTGASRSIIQSNTPLSLLGFVTAANGNTLSFSGLTGLLNPPTVDISQTGVLNFQVTQTNTNTCTSLATPFSLTIQPSIPATQTVCRSTPTVLTSATIGARYEWYKNGTSAPFKLTEIASIQKGTQTASLTLVSPQTTANYFLKVFAANGSFVFEGPFKVTIDYNCTGARQAAPELADVPLSVVLMPNPIANGQVRAVVRGAGGQFLRVTLLNLQGQPAGEQHWTIAEPEQAIELSTAGQPSGMYLLQAQTPGQRTIVKVIKP